MGYPMTFQRFVNRNRLTLGGYEDAGEHKTSLNTTHHGSLSPEDFATSMHKYLVQELQSNEGAWRSLLGDLRRLEEDTLDERSTCVHIADRTGVDTDTVAIVLKEFMSW